MLYQDLIITYLPDTPSLNTLLREKMFYNLKTYFFVILDPVQPGDVWWYGCPLRHIA